MTQLYIFCFCFFGIFVSIYAAEIENTICLEEEKALVYLEMAENSLTKARNSVPSCKENLNSTVDSDCGGKHIAQIEISKKLISDVRRNFPKCPKSIEKEMPKDCSDILASGYNESGVYTVWLSETFTTKKPLQVYCDMETDGGGWTVMQRRGKFPVQQDFYQDWETYKNGFGNITEEFWLGNEKIRILCHNGCELRVDIHDARGNKSFARYPRFYLWSKEYTLKISGYTGDAGDGFHWHDNYKFSTKDHGDTATAKLYKGGWWYRGMGESSNLNGLHQYSSWQEEVYWDHRIKIRIPSSVEMKVRTWKI